jgi:DNA mismatch repair protein MutS2
MNEKSIRVLEFNKILNKIQEYAISESGKNAILSIKPTNNKEEVLLLQASLSEASAIIYQKGNIPLSYIYDLIMDAKVANIGSVLGAQSLVRISQTMRSVRILNTFFNQIDEIENKYPLINMIKERWTVFRDFEEQIEMSIGSEYEILDSASSILRDIRRKIDSKHQQIRHKLDSYLKSAEMSKMLQDHVITIKNDRFVLPVKSEYKSAVKGTVHDQSGSGSTFYIEPSAVVELNNELSSLKVDEMMEIERILSNLSGIVGNNSDKFIENYKSLVQMDILNAKAKYSIQIKGMEPFHSKEKYIKIRNGRHPLLEQKSVVPLTMEIGEEYSSLLITGPNTGGKTVTLKTVGLFCLMYQSGLHLPLEYGSSFPIFDHILADIGDEQSIEQSLSTFSSHMTNIVQIINEIDENSLVLLDELGAGTDPVEGAALAISILTEINKIGSICISTTHYSELKNFALTTPGYKNASVEFDVKTLSPTYKLIIGLPGKSNAFEISSKLGLNDNIIQRAYNYLDVKSVEFEDILSAIERDRKEAQRLKDEAIVLNSQAQKYKDQYEKKYDKLSEMQTKELDKIRNQAKSILQNAKEESDRIVKELRDIQISSQIDNKKIENLRTQLKETINSTNQKTNKGNKYEQEWEKPIDLNIGDEVFVISLGKQGIVNTKPDNNGNLNVSIGILKFGTNIKDLGLIENQKKKENESKVTRSYSVRRTNISSEIDLRGFDLEQAIMELDKYIDDALIANLPQIRIIHGKGTGVLRMGMKDFLKSHKHIKEYRDGTYHEGGIGVTIAVLK